MSQHLFVVSDLHLGGGSGFRMITAEGVSRLGRFVRSVTALEQPGQNTHLVLAGDIVDFLAEEPFSAFTADDELAKKKLERVFLDTAEFWDALRDHLRAGGELSLMIGNHDIELSLPKARRALLERLGPGRIDFTYDNQALTIGPVLIEHGNRYDGWNMVNHDQLRQVRSALSRRQPPPPFRAQPGSEMVIKIMNPLKQKYSFIDLLKPEDSAVPPLLAMLEPSKMADLRSLFELARLGAESRQKWTDEDRAHTPAALVEKTEGLTGQVRSVFSHVAHELHMHDLASSLTRVDLDDPDGEAGAHSSDEFRSVANDPGHGFGATVDFAQLWNAARNADRDRIAVLRRLRQALLARAGDDAQAFRIDYEAPVYLDPARDSARRGYKVIVYGHTHLVRRVNLSGPGISTGARYFNSGTWADLMRVPDAILRPDTPDEVAMEELAAFADDLSHNRVEKWRHHRPTFVRVDLDDGLELEHADVLRYVETDDTPGTGQKLPDGILPL